MELVEKVVVVRECFALVVLLLDVDDGLDFVLDYSPVTSYNYFDDLLEPDILLVDELQLT